MKPKNYIRNVLGLNDTEFKNVEHTFFDVFNVRIERYLSKIDAKGNHYKKCDWCGGDKCERCNGTGKEGVSIKEE